MRASFNPGEAADQRRAREVLLSASSQAAVLLGRWEAALRFNGEFTASMRRRDAPAAVIAEKRFNDHWPLLRLGRVDEALDLLRDCLRLFQDSGSIPLIGKAYAALAAVELEHGHGDAAIRLERDALRYLYQAGDVRGISTSYHTLGNCLNSHARQPAAAGPGSAAGAQGARAVTAPPAVRGVSGAAAAAVTGAPSTVTARTISYLTCTASRASKNPSARNAGSVTCPGCGFRHRDSRSAVTFGSSAGSRTGITSPCR